MSMFCTYISSLIFTSRHLRLRLISNLQRRNHTKAVMSTSAFVKKLAANDRPTRDKAYLSLKKFLSSKKSGLSLLDMEKLWKGLYYLMWLCDRPGPQQKLAENLGSLYSNEIPDKLFCNFVEAFWVVMIKEWPSIDQWRIDKYLLLIRRIIRHCLIRLNKSNWSAKMVESYNEVLTKLVLSGDRTVPVALPYHLCDIYVEEIEYVIFEDIKEEEDEIEDVSSEEYQEFFKRKLEIVSKVPVKKLIEPFEQLNKSALLKTLREKCKEEVLDDERLVLWGVVEPKKQKKNKADKENSDEDDNEEADDGSDSEDEWNGF